MQTSDGQSDITPFSYEILDDEAHKISDLISAVQKKIVQNGEALALFHWAEEFDNRGERQQAEFLYLHFIGLYEKQYGAIYPIAFKGLREYARSLFNRTASAAPKLKAS